MTIPHNQYTACLHVVAGRGVPPVSFLDELCATIKSLPEEIFAVNDSVHDIYGVVKPVLGPWQGILHRRAALAEVLRVLAGLEASWNWNEGRDTSAGPQKPDEMESGVFQVSANSLHFDPSLPACLDRLAGSHDTATFISAMKSNHALAVEYCARLLRVRTNWDGPINRGELTFQPKDPTKPSGVRRDAVEEFERLLA